MTDARTISTAFAFAISFVLSIIYVLVTQPATQAQEPGTYLGTLTCILSPASKEAFGVERELSCVFEPMTGPQSKLQGVVKRLGVPESKPDRIVMIWTVFGPSAENSVADLQGRYIGSMGAQSDFGLIGGWERSIRLKPLNNAPVFENGALSILELELSAMKA